MKEGAEGRQAISANGITCRRGGRKVFSNLSFSLGSGQILEVSGPNGSGKTTLLRALAGIHPVEEGSLEVPRDEVAYLGHRHGLKGKLTVDENLGFWADVHGGRTGDLLLDHFDFRNIRHRRAELLSAGQRKRVAVASLMVSGKAIWLLDEPLTALDSGWAGKVVDAVRDHCASGGLAVLTTLVKSIPEAAMSVELPPASAGTGPQGELN